MSVMPGKGADRFNRRAPKKLQTFKVVNVRRSPQGEAALNRLAERIKGWSEWSSHQKLPFRFPNN